MQTTCTELGYQGDFVSTCINCGWKVCTDESLERVREDATSTLRKEAMHRVYKGNGNGKQTGRLLVHGALMRPT